MTVSIRNIPQEEVESVKLSLRRSGVRAFLTLPTSCAGPLQTTLQGESWGAETASLSASLPELTGCDRLSFEPTLRGHAGYHGGWTPVWLRAGPTRLPAREPGGLAAAHLKDASVTLPEGAGISLSAADGLRACTEAQVALDFPRP